MIRHVDSPEDPYAGLPLVLRQWMFPDYTPPPKGKVWERSDEWLIQECRQEEAFHESTEPRIREWEYSINGYNFRQIREELAFRNICKHYNSSSVPDEELQHKIYFCIERNGRTMCTIVIDDDVIIRIKYIDNIWCRDKILMAKLQIVISKWRELCRLKSRRGLIGEDSRLLTGRQFHISQLPVDERWGKMGIRRMWCMAEKGETGPGFYLKVYRNFYMTDLLFLRPMPPDDADDIECLQKQWPYAKHLLAAVAGGDPEACYVMHLIYVDGNFNLFHEPNFRRSEWWYKKTVENGWLEVALDKDDICL